jgi:hypothetical protein
LKESGRLTGTWGRSCRRPRRGRLRHALLSGQVLLLLLRRLCCGLLNRLLLLLLSRRDRCSLLLLLLLLLLMIGRLLLLLICQHLLMLSRGELDGLTLGSIAWLTLHLSRPLLRDHPSLSVYDVPLCLLSRVGHHRPHALLLHGVLLLHVLLLLLLSLLLLLLLLLDLLR